MSTERKYSEEEIAAIFEEAAEAQKVAQKNRAQTEGLTLAELQEIGDDLGLTADFIAQAASKIDQPAEIEIESDPVSFWQVEHHIDLPAPLSDENWDKLVVDLRRTFKAQGKIQRDGSLRSWRNGNLNISVEPNGNGQQLRMTSRNSNTQNAMTAGMGLAAMFAVFIPIALLKGTNIDSKLMMLSAFILAGLAITGFSALTVPKWKKLRKKQMKAIGERALLLVSSQKTKDEIGLDKTESIQTTTPTNAPLLDLENVPEVTNSAKHQPNNPARTRS